VPSLQAVAQASRLQGIISQPDRPAGRGQKLRPTPVKTAAAAYGVPVYEPRSLKAFASEHAGEHYDLFVLASYGRILPAELLEVPRIGALNVHPSLLPHYRGATPIQSALRNGDAQTGVSIIMMDAGMDTGPLILQTTVQIEPQDTYATLHDRLAKIGAKLITGAIELATQDELAPRPQTGEPSVTKPLSKGDLIIDWEWPGERIVNAIRAYSPQPAARSMIAGVAVKLLQARRGPSSEGDCAPGELLASHGDALVIACGDGTIEIERVIPANRAAMTGEAFVRWLKAQAK